MNFQQEMFEQATEPLKMVGAYPQQPQMHDQNQYGAYPPQQYHPQHQTAMTGQATPVQQGF